MGKLVMFPINDYILEWQYSDYYENEEEYFVYDSETCKCSEYRDVKIGLLSRIFRVFRNLFC